MAAPRQGLPVPLERVPHRGAAFALSNASERARTRSIGSRSRGSLFIFRSSPAVAPYLAVQQRANKLTGPILCLVGPAGVGKTSLGRSIARATGRNFVRFSLGGVHDEAEIRGR